MKIEESSLVEETVNCESESRAYAQNCTEGVGAWAQVGFLAQEFKGVALLLHGVSVVGGAVNFKFGGLHFHSLAFAHRLDERADYADSGACGDEAKVVFGKLLHIEHDLEVFDCRTIVESHELNIFVATAGTHPTFHFNFLAYEFF